MISLSQLGLVRMLWLGASALSLAACASTPFPAFLPFSGPPSGAPPSPAEEPRPVATDTAPRVLDPSARLQCVPFARRASGIEIYGNANTWWRQAEGRYQRSRSPAPGAVLVTRGYRTARRGHVAVVSDIVSDRIIRVDQANWLNGGEISVGVPVMDVSPGNDWSQVRVWHIPGGHWGGRVYVGEGFIHTLSQEVSLHRPRAWLRFIDG